MTMTELETIPPWGRQASIPACSGLPTLGVGVQPCKNPYSPGAGLHPAALVGRCGELHDWNVALRRVEIARPAQSVVLHGLRGMGKTVLLGEFYRRAEDRHWMTVIIEANTGTPCVTPWRAPSTPWSESSSDRKSAKSSRRHWPPSRRSVRRSTLPAPGHSGATSFQKRGAATPGSSRPISAS